MKLLFYPFQYYLLQQIGIFHGLKPSQPCNLKFTDAMVMVETGSEIWVWKTCLQQALLSVVQPEKR